MDAEFHFTLNLILIIRDMSYCSVELESMHLILDFAIHSDKNELGCTAIENRRNDYSVIAILEHVFHIRLHRRFT